MNSMRLNRQRRRAMHARGEWIPLERVHLVPRSDKQIEAAIDHAATVAPNLTRAQIREAIDRAGEEAGEVWKNDRYQVHVIRWEPLRINDRLAPVIQLSIRTLDRAPARDWRDFQRIKNQLVGPECEAIELYPAESRLVDTANQFHIWCVNDTRFRFPFGWDAGRMTTSDSGGGSVQRPLDDANKAAVK